MVVVCTRLATSPLPLSATIWFFVCVHLCTLLNSAVEFVCIFICFGSHVRMGCQNTIRGMRAFISYGSPASKMEMNGVLQTQTTDKRDAEAENRFAETWK
jgi:hypothetical protein